MYVCMYVCTYVRMYVCTYVRMYVLYVLYVCSYVHMYVCTYVRACVYAYCDTVIGTPQFRDPCCIPDSGKAPFRLVSRDAAAGCKK